MWVGRLSNFVFFLGGVVSKACCLRDEVLLSLKLSRLGRMLGVDPFLEKAPPFILFSNSVLTGKATLTIFLVTGGAGFYFIIFLTFDSTLAYFFNLVSFLAGFEAVFAYLQLLGVSGFRSKAEFKKLLFVEAVESLNTGNNSYGGDTI